MAYVSFINVWISAKSFIWELFQNRGGLVTNRSHSNGTCVSLALFPWLNVFSMSFYLLWFIKTQSYHSLNIRTPKVLLTLWTVEELRGERFPTTIIQWWYFEHKWWYLYQAWYKLFTHIVSPKDTLCRMLADTFHNTVQENKGWGDAGELLREKQKTQPATWRVDFVPRLPVFKVEMKILIPPEIFFEEIWDNVGKVPEIITVPQLDLPSGIFKTLDRI